MSTPPSDTLIIGNVDEVQLFMLYTLTGGNVERTASISRVEPDVITALAHDRNWRARIGGRGALDSELGKSAEQAVNRLTNYVTAERLGNVFANIIARLDTDPEFARQFCLEWKPKHPGSDDGEYVFTAKQLVELAKGLEIVSNVKYRALGDKVALEASVSGNAQAPQNISINIYKALAARFESNPAIDHGANIIDAVAVDATKG